MNNPKSRAAIYASILKANKNVVISIESQIECCKAHYLKLENQYELVQIYSDEAVSSTDFNRPSLQLLFAAARDRVIDRVFMLNYKYLGYKNEDGVHLYTELMYYGVTVITVPKPQMKQPISRLAVKS